MAKKGKAAFRRSLGVCVFLSVRSKKVCPSFPYIILRGNTEKWMPTWMPAPRPGGMRAFLAFALAETRGGIELIVRETLTDGASRLERAGSR